jgi:hypothetical protein
MKAAVSAASILERIVDERVGQTIVRGVSTAIDRIADEIAKETLQDDAFRRSLRELVHSRSEELLAELLKTSKPKKRKRRK